MADETGDISGGAQARSVVVRITLIFDILVTVQRDRERTIPYIGEGEGEGGGRR